MENKTEIFNSYQNFLDRKDKKINGVSEQFAKNNPDYEKQNLTNDGSWNCRYCSSCSDCSDCSEKQKEGDQSKIFSEECIPMIENIHQKILESLSNPDALKMDNWHTSKDINEDGAYCGTTHCRAGWVVALAGKEGKKLEEKTNTPFAAMMIYKKSSSIKVSPVRFYEHNDIAMDDIKRCAIEESSRKAQ